MAPSSPQCCSPCGPQTHRTSASGAGEKCCPRSAESGSASHRTLGSFGCTCNVNIQRFSPAHDTHEGVSGHRLFELRNRRAVKCISSQGRELSPDSRDSGSSSVCLQVVWSTQVYADPRAAEQRAQTPRGAPTSAREFGTPRPFALCGEPRHPRRLVSDSDAAVTASSPE